MSRSVLFLAALPALGGSLLIMQAAGASRALVVQQIAVSVIAALIGWMLGGTRARPAARVTAPLSTAIHNVVIVVALVALALPIVVAFTDTPHRWVIVGGLRLYMAALALPAALLSLSETWPDALSTIAIITIGGVLAAQPDASQVTAFAGAMAFTVLRNWNRPLLTLATVTGPVACSLFAWRQPDPLLPVPYVEGVLDVAASAGRLAWLAAVACLAVPPMALAWKASTTGRRGLLAPAVYYVIIGLMAWRQLTPMPLLGFGASPILGYFLMAGLAARMLSAS